MKLCETCNEFACGQSGTKAISEYCGSPDFKIHCAVITTSRETAKNRLLSITKNQHIISCLETATSLRYETNKEIWDWVSPRIASSYRGCKFVRVHIDESIKLSEYFEIQPYLSNVVDDELVYFQD